MRILKLIAAVMFAFAPVPAISAAPSEQEAAAAFAAAKAAIGAPEDLHLVIAPADAADVTLTGDTLTIPRKAFQLAHSRQELTGLYILALSLAYAPAPGEKPKHPSLEEYLAAGAVAVAGEAADPISRRSPDRSYLRSYGDRDERRVATQAPAVSPRGRRVLAAMRRVGTCSGPALAYLDRLGRELPSRAAIVLARSARDDFGPLAYPPEYDCAPD
ncbi:MAG TPA: hypothetical protein VH331_17970 [Allosphingosinicella sp.]|jgi:hypothetical protein|nr:hypothetical protein [Allosphingosinicella sp.]